MTANLKKKIVAGLKRKWERKGGDPDLFSIYADDWFKKLAATHRRKVDRLFAVQGGSCYYCKCTMHPGVKGQLKKRRATIDHKILQSQGGTDSYANIVLACSDCNGLRADMPFEEFDGMIRELGYRRTRQVIFDRRRADKKIANKRRRANRLRRQQEMVEWMAFLMICLDNYAPAWYGTEMEQMEMAA